MSLLRKWLDVQNHVTDSSTTWLEEMNIRLPALRTTSRTRLLTEDPHLHRGPAFSLKIHIFIEDQPSHWRPTSSSRTRLLTEDPHLHRGPAFSLKTHIFIEDPPPHWRPTSSSRTRLPTEDPHLHRGPGMWSRSRRLGLETVSRPIEGLVSVSSRACRQTSRSRLGLGS